jgi:hypothetical protein
MHAAVLYMDNMDVIHLDLSKSDNVDAALEGLQRSVTNWSHLLIVTGRSFMPSNFLSSDLLFVETGWIMGV